MDHDLLAQILRFRDARDWKQFHTSRNLAASIAIEAAELLELFQWARDDELAQLAQARRERIREEMADVLIYLALMAHDLDIDLEAAARDKLAANERKYPVERARGSAAKYDEFGGNA